MQSRGWSGSTEERGPKCPLRSNGARQTWRRHGYGRRKEATPKCCLSLNLGLHYSIPWQSLQSTRCLTCVSRLYRQYTYDLRIIRDASALPATTSMRRVSAAGTAGRC